MSARSYIFIEGVKNAQNIRFDKNDDKFQGLPLSAALSC